MNVHQENKIQLIPLEEKDYEQFKLELQASFTQGVIDSFGEEDAGPIPSDEVIYKSLYESDNIAFHFVLNDEKVGGIIVKINTDTQLNSIDLLFISLNALNRGLGLQAWKAVEEMFPDTKVWELVTPYFEKRNIHFYVNKCGFHIVEFYNKYNPEPNQEEEQSEENHSPSVEEFEFFRFQKIMK